MKPLDRKLQQRVWSRVYEPSAAPLTPQQKQALRKCLQRSKENLSVFERKDGYGIYAEAFAKLRTETTEHIKMLQQMLR